MSRERKNQPDQPRPVVGYLIVGAIAVGAAASVPMMWAARDVVLRESESLRSSVAASAPIHDSLRRASAVVQKTLTLETARADARAEPGLHLVIAVDSGTVALVRDGITLRSMPARFLGAPPARGSQAIARLEEGAAPPPAVPTVDSSGNAVAVPERERTVERAILTDGTILEGGDAAAAFLGGLDARGGPRAIAISRRDFAALRPNLRKGMSAVLF